jgi:hypothetical protein
LLSRTLVCLHFMPAGAPPPGPDILTVIHN